MRECFLTMHLYAYTPAYKKYRNSSEAALKLKIRHLVCIDVLIKVRVKISFVLIITSNDPLDLNRGK